ncbi:hypothetical protein AAC387_Pa07g3171 [Persea americana]
MVMADNSRIPSEWAQSHYGRTIGRPVDPLRTPPGERSSIGGETSIRTSTATTTTNMHVNARGGIGKPTKRRSRASRKGPITLFNTDTANFRAMVQQYTGAPAVAISSGSQPGPPTVNFGFGGRGLDPYQGMMVPPSQTHPTLQQLQQQLVLQRGGESLFSLGNNNRATSDMGISDGFLEGMSSYGQTSNEPNNGLHFTREDGFRSQY